MCVFFVFFYKLSVTSIIEWEENAELVRPLPPGLQNRPQRAIIGFTRPEASCNTSPGAHTRETHGAGTPCTYKKTHFCLATAFTTGGSAVKRRGV